MNLQVQRWIRGVHVVEVLEARELTSDETVSEGWGARRVLKHLSRDSHLHDDR